MESTDGGERKSSYQYDNCGNLIKTVDRNQIGTNYTYDGLNRLVAKENSKDGRKTKIQFTFDKLGQNRQILDASGKTIFDYDDLGRLTTVNYGNGIRQKYSYDQADRVTNLLVRQGGLTQMDLQYVYDGIGRLKTVNDQGKKFGYSYDAAGKLIQEQNGVTGIKSDYRYYPSGNIKSMRHSLADETVSFYEYQYDKRGNQVQKNEGVGTTQYYYDALSRIKTVLQPDSSILNYEYDDLNNIKEMAEINGAKISRTAYTYDADSRLLLQETDNGSEMTQQRFTYDGEGNQLSKEEAVKRDGALVSSADSKFWWNGFNQVERVQDANGQFIDYTYNGLGLRTKKDFGDQAVNYFYDQGNIIMEADQNLMVTAKNIRGKKLIHRETDNQLMYYLHNAHGDVTQLTDEFGKVIKDYRYDPFGQDDSLLMPGFGSNAAQTVWQQEVEKIDNPFQYCGEYLDNETGNYYLRARYYDPGAERFISEDPKEGSINNPLSLNLYTYCINNPIIFTDPSGLAQTLAQKYAGQNVTISWDNNTKTATVYNVRGMKIKDYKDNGDKIRLEKGHIVIYSMSRKNDSNRDGILKTCAFAAINGTIDGLLLVADTPVGAERIGARILGESLIEGTVSIAGKNSVYISKAAADGTVQYVGITNDIARRAAEHMASKGIPIEKLMQGLSRSDARAVEQALIETHGLQKNGGTLINKINSIAATNKSYAEQLQRGYELLKTIGGN